MTPAAIFVACLVVVLLVVAAFVAGRAYGFEIMERRYALRDRYAQESRANLALAGVRDVA